MNNLSVVESIFFAALAKGSPEERAAYLDEACGRDPELRACVERLLGAQPRVGSFLQVPGPGPAATVDEPRDADATPLAERPGTVIGPYRLMEQIGAGGMGLVFVAEQQHPVRRKVALKVIKPGMDSREVIARFEAERQALALMDHPNIAKVLDAGTTDSGLPYFVMELVKGVPLTDYCDQNQLTPRARLELFTHICQAVQHAHQKGVVHRDLKPSNVLVTLHDGTPVVKVIDFGVAKAIGQHLTEKTIYTRFTQLIGTPLYMSPEQAEMSGLDIDTRSDIYALGVLLYELLTGTTPFDQKRLQQAAFDEIRRIIREEEPPRPSTRLTTLGETLSVVSARRRMEPRKLSALVKGDLDWIVMKALEKDRARRYETASALAADVRRFLSEEPVEARPPSAGYRLRKFVRRNRGPVVAGATIAALLVVGVAVSTWQAVRAAWAEQAAVLAREEEAQQRRQAEEQRNRAVDAERVARANEQQAREHERKAAELAVEMMELIQVFQNQVLDVTTAFKDGGKLDQAIAFYEQALAAVKAKLGPVHNSTFISTANLGGAYQAAGKFDQAIALGEQMVPVLKAGPGLDHPATFSAMASLARTYQAAGKGDRAIALYEQILATMTAKLGPDHPVTFRGLSNLANAYWAAGQRAKALSLWEQMIEMQKAELGFDHPGLLVNMYNLAGAYRDAGQPEKALPLYEQTLAERIEKLGPDHPDTVMCRYRLAEAYQDHGDSAKAETLYLETLAQQRKRLGADHAEIAGVLAPLGLIYLQQKKYVQAESLLRECLQIRQKKLPDDWSTFHAQAMLGGSLLGQQKYAAAEPLLVQGYEGMKQREAQIPATGKIRLTEALERVVQFYEATGKPDEAATWRKKLDTNKEARK